MLTQAKLKKLFIYKDGILWWRENVQGRRLSKAAGYINNQGYCSINIGKKDYKRARLVFLLFNGYLPKVIDHKNRDRSDDRISNLRAITHSENMINTKCRSNTGYKYISKTKSKNCKNGFLYMFKLRIKRKIKFIKSSINFEYLLKYRNSYLKKHHPMHFIYLRGE